MHRGKVICKELKEVRRRIAEENEIPLEIKECTYDGPCRGTCPRCEAEVCYLERELARRLAMGKVATVAGLTLGLASCGDGRQQPAAPLLTADTTPADADTVQAIARQSDSVWREPDSLDVVAGGDFAVVLPSDTLNGPAAYMAVEDDMVVEEGEAGPLDPIFTDAYPEFPGGEEALYRFFQDNVKYPQLALENGIEGRVYLTFIVEEDGSVSRVRVLRDIGGGCGLEAKRVAETMPRWKPAMLGGKAVRSEFNLPVNFVLPEDRPRIIEGMAPVTGMPADTSQHEIIGPDSPTQKMVIEGVKVIVR